MIDAETLRRAAIDQRLKLNKCCGACLRDLKLRHVVRLSEPRDVGVTPDGHAQGARGPTVASIRR